MNEKRRFDIKVGYTCNNHCVHCVVSPTVENLIRNNIKIDLIYGEIINIIKSNEFASAPSVVITGGEPTLRKDFMRIIKIIVNNYPSKKIVLQTNGRLLYKYIDELKLLTSNITYIVAIHSIDENIHNNIVNNRIKGDKSYTETIKSLRKLVDSYSNFKDIGRVEIVLSKFNYKTLYKTIIELYKIGLNNIGISYPHLDGHYYNYGIEKVKEISLSYDELKPILFNICEFATNNPNLNIEFEEVPRCVWTDTDGQLLLLPNNLKSGCDNPGNPIVIFPERNMKDCTYDTWNNSHIKQSFCKECVFDNCCCGIWVEAFKAFDNKGLIPIKNTKRED